MLLFLSTGLVMNYEPVVMGPVCRRDYMETCGSFETQVRVSPPFILSEAPPNVNMRRLVSNETNGTNGSSSRTWSGWASERVEHLSEFQWHTLFSGFQFDCSLPMCSIFVPKMMDYKLTKNFSTYDRSFFDLFFVSLSRTTKESEHTFGAIVLRIN